MPGAVTSEQLQRSVLKLTENALITEHLVPGRKERKESLQPD